MNLQNIAKVNQDNYCKYLLPDTPDIKCTKRTHSLRGGTELPPRLQKYYCGRTNYECAFMTTHTIPTGHACSPQTPHNIDTFHCNPDASCVNNTCMGNTGCTILGATTLPSAKLMIGGEDVPLPFRRFQFDGDKAMVIQSSDNYECRVPANVSAMHPVRYSSAYMNSNSAKNQCIFLPDDNKDGLGEHECGFRVDSDGIPHCTFKSDCYHTSMTTTPYQAIKKYACTTGGTPHRVCIVNKALNLNGVADYAPARCINKHTLKSLNCTKQNS